MIHILIGLVLAGLDQASKWWVTQPGFETIWLFDNFKILVTQNDGAAFSLPINTLVTIPIALLVIFIISYKLFRHRPKFSKGLAFALILAGAIGNMIDRLRFGYVVDFISVYNFPIFNLADSFITVGIGLYLWLEFIGD